MTKVISGYGTALQNETTFRYDATTFNLKTVTDPLSHSTTFDYDTAGNIISQTGSLNQPYTYTGREYDPETGLYYYRNRYYDAYSGRFLQEDPIWNVNLYGYVYQNPLNLRDPYGLWAVPVFLGGGALLGIAGQGIADAITGQLSSWQTYTGAAVGGAATGITLLYTASPIAAGFAGGAVSNATTQGLNMMTGVQSQFSLGSLVVSTIAGTALGMIPGPRWTGVTAGRNSFNAIFKQMFTKFKTGQIAHVRLQTALKMFTGSSTKTNMLLGGTAGSLIGTLTGTLGCTP